MTESDPPTPIEPLPGPPPLMQSVRRNSRALLAGMAMTLAILCGSALIWPVSKPGTATTLMMVQLVFMTVFMPAAAYGAGRPIDVVYRSGVTTDSFGLFMLIAGTLAGGWSALGAIKLYLLLTGCGLMLMGAYMAVRRFRNSSLWGALGMFLLAALVVGFHGAASAEFISSTDGIFGKLNLLAAGQDALGIHQGDAHWLTTALVYGTAAGVLWAIPLLEWPISPPAYHDDESTD